MLVTYAYLWYFHSKISLLELVVLLTFEDCNKSDMLPTLKPKNAHRFLAKKTLTWNMKKNTIQSASGR